MDKFFKITERGSNVKTEIIAGLTTFFAMAYIIVVNPNQIVGFSFDVPGVGKIWNAVYIASIIAAVIGTLLYAFYAKLPFAQACGMGLNSFFFTSFVLPQIINGGDVIKGYQAGLVIILLSGIVFMILSITGLRSYIAKAMPECIKKAISAGIGLFIAFIGFQNVGIIQANQYTLVQFVKINGAAWKDIAPAIIGGVLEDTTDDLIGDAELYHRYVDMISENEVDITDPASVTAMARAASADIVERVPNARKKLAKIFEVMLYAHASARFRTSADQILSSLK